MIHPPGAPQGTSAASQHHPWARHFQGRAPGSAWFGLDPACETERPAAMLPLEAQVSELIRGLTRLSRAPGCVKGVLCMCQVCTCGPQGRQSRVWSSPQSCVRICCSELRLLWSSVERGAVQSRAF